MNASESSAKLSANSPDHRSGANQSPPGETVAPGQSLRWYRTWRLPLIAVLLLTPILFWLNSSEDPVITRSIVNLATFSVGGALVLTVLFWFCMLSTYSRRTVLLVMVPLLLVTVGWAASIRQIQFKGHMDPIIYYRWEEDPFERDLNDLASAVEARDDAAGLDQAERHFELAAGDVPAFRGMRRDGVIEGPALNQDWQQQPPRELWRVSVGAGYSSMSVVGDSLITLEQRGQQEAITCYDATNGQLRWVHQYPARFFEAMGGLGPRSTPTIDAGQVFAVGAEGHVTCLDFFTGRELWSRALLKELEIPNVTWALASSPLVLGEAVIVNPGGPGGDGLMALHRDTGETLWQGAGLSRYGSGEGSTNHAGYSSPVLMEVDGIEQIVIFDGHGLSGHDPLSGTRWWHFPYLNNAGVNVAQPILLESGREFFISASYGMGSALVEVKRSGEDPAAAWQAEQKWHETTQMRSKFSNPVYYQGMVYGLDEGILACIDPRTGQRKWKKGRYNHGQVLLTNGQLLVMSEEGDLILVDANPDEFREVTRMPVLSGSKVRVWNPHTLVNGIVYVRDDKQMAAFDLNQPSP